MARRWAVPLALVVALVVVALTLDRAPTRRRPGARGWPGRRPTFDLRFLVGLALPLFVVNIASQYAPGVAVMKTFGYDRALAADRAGHAPASRRSAAPFGGHAVNLAAISAALAASPEAHPDPRRRWMAAVSAAGSYVVLGLLSARGGLRADQRPRRA